MQEAFFVIKHSTGLKKDSSGTAFLLVFELKREYVD